MQKPFLIKGGVVGQVTLKEMIKAILDEYLEDCVEWLECNPQELEPDCLLREDVVKVAEDKTKTYSRYLDGLPRYRVQALYDAAMSDMADRTIAEL